MYRRENMTLRLLRAIQLARMKGKDGFNTPQGPEIEFQRPLKSPHDEWAEMQRRDLDTFLNF